MRCRTFLAGGALALWCATWCASWAAAAAPRVLPEGQLPDDRRLGPLKTLNDYFPFTPCATSADWSARSEQLRRQVLVANGLWPMPTKTPADAVIHGLVDRESYTVERVCLQSFPGHYVTGSLYRPKGRSGRLPGVLCPHGHWANGRFHDHGEKAAAEQIAQGGEKFAVGGRHPLQARCVHLARMGCVVFHYDMVGYADSQQIVHRPGVRAAMNAPSDWGYFSPQAEARLQNMMGLQTYNSIRALDWFCELPDVDPRRIGVTGASGGGTQTFILCAIDPRPAVAFPAVMVGTAMQGGCTCENAPYLRVGTGNVEIAALFAPRPLGMTAADDWTKEIETKGLPELKRHYQMLAAPDRVSVAALLQFKHNYNYPSRAAMYGWMNKHLRLGYEEPPAEEDFRPLSVAEMTVWDDQHRKPPHGDDYERSLLKWIAADSQRQMSSLFPADAPTLTNYRLIVGGAVDVMIGRGLPGPKAVEAKAVEQSEQEAWTFSELLVRHAAAGEEVPVVHWQPKQWNKTIAVWVKPEGKQELFGDDGGPRPEVQKLLAAGAAVVGADLFGQGECTADGRAVAANRMARSGREDQPGYAGYTYGYNHPLFAQRVHDILSVVAWLRDSDPQASIRLLGLAGAGHWVAAARAQAGAAVDRAAIDTAGFRFAALAAFDHADFLPGGAKYDDLPGLLALSAPRPLWVAGEEAEGLRIAVAAYRAAGSAENLTTCSAAEPSARQAAAIAWLAK